MQIARRPQHPVSRFVLSLTSGGHAYLLPLLSLLLAWGCAFAIVVVPSWRHAGRPGHLAYYTLWTMGTPTLLAVITALMLLLILLSVLFLWLVIAIAALLVALLYKRVRLIPVPLAILWHTYSVSLLGYMVLWGVMYALAGVMLAG